MLDPRTGEPGGRCFDPAFEAGRYRRCSLQPVEALVADAFDPHQRGDILGRASGDDAHHRVPTHEPPELVHRLGQDRRHLRPGHDRRERPVDVEQDRGALGGREARRHVGRLDHRLIVGGRAHRRVFLSPEAEPVADWHRMDDQAPEGISPTGSFPYETTRRNAFPPIAEYGFLSDREVMALVAPSGAIEWLCLPRPDSPSVFGALLDRSAGHFRIGPVEQTVPAGRRYLPGTNVLETTWQTRTGWLIVRDVLVIGPWYEDEHRDETYERPPDDHQAEHCLMRQVMCVNGQVDVSVYLEPVFDYARHDATWSYAGTGYGQATARGEKGDPVLHVATDLRLGLEGRSATVQTRMREGDRAFVAMSWGHEDHPGPMAAEDAEERMQETSDFWREWLNQGEFPDHPWRTYLQRSALVLKGLQYAPTGALLAAATTSLPEVPGGERNWDYRYTWVRDSTFALWGLFTLGFDREARAFFSFIRDRIGDGDRLQVMYGVGGERELTERSLPHLSGYERSRPVRIGNAAWEQKQHDVWGALIDSVYLNLKAGEYMAPDFLSERADPGRAGDRELARARPGDLGGAGRAEALHQLQDHVLGGARPRRPDRRGDGEVGSRGQVAGRRR